MRMDLTLIKCKNYNKDMQKRDVEIASRLKIQLKDIGCSQEEINSIIKKQSALRKFRTVSRLNLLDYIQEINEPAHTFCLIGAFAVLEGFIAVKQRKKLEKLQMLMKKHLDFNDKFYLLNNFLFSEEFEFRKADGYPYRHLMFKDFQKDKNFKDQKDLDEDPEFCSGEKLPICYCLDWLKQKQNIDKTDCYLDRLVKNLYNMRHAVVHEGFVIFGLPEQSRIPGTFSNSVSDTYPVSKDEIFFQSYESYLEPKYFLGIIKRCVKSYLLKQYT